jgi:ABC-type transporter Mla MlaB component
MPPAYPLSGETMLRAEMQDSEKGLVLRLEGRFAGDDAEHVRMLMTRRNIEGQMVVDLTQVTFIDSVGEATLSFLSRLGAKFVAEDVYMLDVCKRLHLALARNDKLKQAAPQLKRPRTANDG